MPITMQRRAQARRLDVLIQQAAPALRSAVARDKNLYVRQCAEAYRNTGHLKDDDFLAHERRIAEVLYKHFLRVGRLTNGEIFESLKAKRPSLERKAESKFEYLLKEWAREEAARKAKPIAGTTRKDINRAIQRAYAAEAPETDVINGILEARGYSNFRADAVARTETHNAAMFASLTTAKDFADMEDVVMLKFWTPTIDDRTRTIEKNQDGHLEMADYGGIGMTELFDVPSKDGGSDRMSGPGDHSAPADQVINCRCVLTFEVQ